MTIRVALVDDQELIRVGFRMVLDMRPEIEVVGEADDGVTALELLATTAVDVVLMDVEMPRMNGVEATRRIRELGLDVAVLILTTFDLDEYAFDALRAGAGGFLLKDTPVDEIAAAITHVYDGDSVVAPSTTRRLLDHFAGAAWAGVPDPRNTATLESLTAREREVLTLVAAGSSNAEIADQLVVTEGTAKVHVSRILTKLGVRDRVQAVVWAYESGVVRPGQQR
ncbi:response regulator [Gordonia soli]|uniref:Putative two-component response regulator n=1 Tax=Gordonia soli NBRC 108243 TaxID=1223545 RepID=M0QEQ4_9ACTN|nr:response regulator transcription factor [Gordonia soli]GAC66914.1 putative two-component response regulator [Gordonia soli NBRC 108243]